MSVKATETAPSETAPMTALEEKRLAVLASMKRRRAAAPSRSTSQSPLVPGTAIAQGVLIGNLEEAVLDLRSLGYTFDMILERSGTSREFLERCFNRWNFPVPSRPVEQHPAQHDHRQHHHTPLHTYHKPLYSNKVYRPNSEKPEWLKGLVIDLNSSEEESGDEDEMDEEDEVGDEEQSVEEENSVHDATEQDPQGVSSSTSLSSNFGQQESLNVDADDYDPDTAPVKRRKLSNEIRFGHLSIEELMEKKEQLSKRIDTISEQVEINDKRSLEIQSSIAMAKYLLLEKEKRVNTYRNLILALEPEIQQQNDVISSLTHESRSIPDSRAEMATCLIEMDELEAEEKRLKETERKRIELRDKLVKQLKEKKKKKQEEEQQQQQQQQQQHQSEQMLQLKQLLLDSGSVTTQQKHDIGTNENIHHKDDANVHDETVHKISKEHASNFTPYKSLGLSHSTVKSKNDNDNDNDILCPLELVNGTCTDKGCHFTHLNV